jgi:hypothetical protein
MPLSHGFGRETDCSLPLIAANQKHKTRKFAGIILVSDSESWVARYSEVEVGSATNFGSCFDRKSKVGKMTTVFFVIHLVALAKWTNISKGRLWNMHSNP